MPVGANSMYESNINLLREEAQRLIGEEIKLLKEIQATPNLLTEHSDSESEQSFDVKSLPELIEQLEGEVILPQNHSN